MAAVCGGHASLDLFDEKYRIVINDHGKSRDSPNSVERIKSDWYDIFFDGFPPILLFTVSSKQRPDLLHSCP